jgi:hypothetical protein
MPTPEIDPSDALEAVLAVDRGDDPIFELEAFVEAVLEFANERDSEFRLDRYLRLTGGVTTRLRPRESNRKSKSPDITFDQREQQWLEERLVRIMEGGDQARLEVAREVVDEADRMVLFPRTVVGPGKSGATIETHYNWEADTPSTVLSRGLIVILDTRKQYADRLCRCRFEGCNRWFLAPTKLNRRGAPNTAYCSKDHAIAAYREKKRLGSERWRARKKANADLPRPPRRRK